MSDEPTPNPRAPAIETRSVEEGLDFACQLLQLQVSARGREHPDEAAGLLQSLCFYIETRYVGEPELALEALARLAHASAPMDDRLAPQIWAQLRWLVGQLGIPAADVANLRLPESPRDIR